MAYIVVMVFLGTYLSPNSSSCIYCIQIFLYFNHTLMKCFLKKQAKDMNRHFSNENTQMPNKHIKRCSALLVIREMQIQITMKYHCSTTGISKIKINDKRQDTYLIGRTRTSQAWSPSFYSWKQLNSVFKWQ